MHTALILEDDISIAWEYELILKELNVEVVGVIKSWEGALPAIRKASPDLVIVDLVLSNDQKGFQFIEGIKNLFIPMIICTGYPENSNIEKALELGVEAFLTKPLDRSAFVFQVKKVLSKSSDYAVSEKYMVVTERGKLIKVPYDKIAKIVVDGNYSYIVMDNGKRFVIKQSLSKIHDKLDHNRFIRCHRSCVVNLSFVSGIDAKNYKILMTTGEEEDIGNRFRKDVKSLFKQN